MTTAFPDARRRPATAVLLAALLLCGGTSPATTFGAREIRCPLCERGWGEIVITSCSENYYPRDLSRGGFALFGKVWTCPHCLYSTLNFHASDLSEEEKAALREAMPAIAGRIVRDEADVVRGAMEAPESRWTDLLHCLLARECDRYRPPDPMRDVDLARFTWYQSLRVEDPGVVRRYRSRFIAVLEPALDGGRIADPDWQTAEPDTRKLILTYLLGEAHRLNGDDAAARRRLETARRTAEEALEGGVVRPPCTKWELKEIRLCANEQLLRIAYPLLGTAELEQKLKGPHPEPSVALEVLGDRSAPDAWQALSRFARESPENLEAFLRVTRMPGHRIRLDPELWAYVQDQYAKVRSEVENKAAVENEEEKDRIECKRRWFLPRLDSVVHPEPVQSPDETSRFDDLLMRGAPEGLAFFPESDRPWIRDCLAMRNGDAAAGARLLQELDEAPEWEPKHALMIRAFTRLGDRSALSVVLRQLKRGPGRGIRDAAYPYLHACGNEDDIPLLEEADDRLGVWSVIKSIRMKRLFETK